MDPDEARLRAWCAHAEAALPELRLPHDEFARYVAAHPRGRELLDAPSEAPPEVVEELWLACGLRRGAPEALRAFSTRYLAPLRDTLARVRLDADGLEEVAQRVRTKLLVPDASGKVRIEEYVGRGRLGGLVQVVATREAVSLLRRTRRERPLPERDEALRGSPSQASGWDVAVRLARAEHREAFREAFANAVSALDARDRNLLRMHLLGGVGLEQLAASYRVHRATIVRWIAAAREKLLEATRNGVKARLEVGSGELDSLMASVQKGLDLSVERYFRTVDHE